MQYLLRLTIRDSVPESYQGRPQLLETFKPSKGIKQDEKRTRCHPKSDYRILTSDAFLNQKPNKQTSHE